MHPQFFTAVWVTDYYNVYNVHADGVHGNYYLVRTEEAGRTTCVYEGDKPSYDMSQFVPVPVRKGHSFMRDPQIDWLTGV